jgi:hypothetical protein
MAVRLLTEPISAYFCYACKDVHIEVDSFLMKFLLIDWDLVSSVVEHDGNISKKDKNQMEMVMCAGKLQVEVQNILTKLFVQNLMVERFQ